MKKSIMANIGYIRIGIIEQAPSQQLEELSLDKIFEEKISSFGNFAVTAG